MKGEDVRAWQRDVKAEFAEMDIKCPITTDGDYGLETRSFTASLCRAIGLNAAEAMDDGVTPDLRIKIRHRHLTRAQEEEMRKRVDYRRALRRRWGSLSGDGELSLPVKHIVSYDWGFHPPGHDGIDIITRTNPEIFSVIKSRVFDVRSGGWWGKAAAPNPDVRAKGDGIIQLEVLETIGPLKKGMHIGYGHAEHAQVREGQIIPAGHYIGRAGLANAWHIHWMINNGNTTQGRGNIDPEPILEYLIKHT